AAAGRCGGLCAAFQWSCSWSLLAPRAARDALVLKLAEHAPQRRMVEHHPRNHDGDDKGGHRVSGDDEVGVRPEIHALFPLRMILSETRFPLFGIMRLPPRAPAPASTASCARAVAGFRCASPRDAALRTET